MRTWCGIDGGGTTTRIRLEDTDGAVLARASGGSINPRSSSPEHIESTLADLFDQVREASGQDPRQAEGLYLGCAGADRPVEQAMFTSLLRKLGVTSRLGLGNDAVTVLAAGLGSDPGCVLIAGTGSIAWARLPDASVRRAGGWGHILGDEGSAWWIGREALARVVRDHEDRGSMDRLGTLILGHLGLRTLQELIPWVYQDFDKARVARLAPVADQARREGSPLAAAIFQDARQALVRLASILAPPGTPIVLHGGLLEGNTWLRDSLSEDLLARGHRILGPGLDACAGACRLSRLVDGA